MGPAYFVIAILGCADGGAQCTPVATLPARYANEAQCSRESALALENHTDFDFPTIVAECRAASAPSAAIEAPRAIPASARRG